MGQPHSTSRRQFLGGGGEPSVHDTAVPDNDDNNNTPDARMSGPQQAGLPTSTSESGEGASLKCPAISPSSNSSSPASGGGCSRWSLTGLGGTNHRHATTTAAAAAAVSVVMATTNNTPSPAAARSGNHSHEDHSHSSSGHASRFSVLRFRRNQHQHSLNEEETTSGGGDVAETEQEQPEGTEPGGAETVGIQTPPNSEHLHTAIAPASRPPLTHPDEPPSLVDFEELDSEDGTVQTGFRRTSSSRDRSDRSLMLSGLRHDQELSMRSLLTASGEPTTTGGGAQDSSSDFILRHPPRPHSTGHAALLTTSGGESAGRTSGRGTGGVLNVDSHDPTLRTSPNLNANNTNNNNSVSFDNSSTGAVFYYTNRRGSVNSVTESGSTLSDMEEEDDLFARGHRSSNALAAADFFPQVSRNHEWMGRSIESLLLGHVARAPVLQLAETQEEAEEAAEFYAARRRSTASTFGGGPAYARRRSSQGSFPGGRRGSLSLSGGHGGTLANYHSRRRPVPTDVDRTYSSDRQGRRGSTSHTPMYRRRSSMAASGSVTGAGTTSPSDEANPSRGSGSKAGPNVTLTLMARESTGKSLFPRNIPNTQCLRSMGGHALYCKLDKPADGIATEVAFLAAAIDSGDWSETQTIVSRLSPRIIGDPMALSNDRPAIDDPNLPPTAHRFYAGGGRVGLERDAFVQAGGVEVLLRVFREKSFVGQEMAHSYDARDLSPEIVASRLAPCWNETMACLRELVFSIPSLVDDGKVSDSDEFLPFLFTLLSHDSCFDSAAALIEEMLAILSQSPQQHGAAEADLDVHEVFQPTGRMSPPTTFFLGNVPGLYRLWGGFNCRQLAQFCRILALLVFEPEDRQLLESPAILKSLELLQLRRNRAVRASRDSTVDMNQSILLGDHQLIKRLLMLLRVMNFAPSLRRIAPYHVIAQYPLITDTLIMLGHGELENWNEIDRQEQLARKLLDEEDVEGGAPLICELGRVAEMLEGLSDTLSDAPNQIGHIIHVITAAQQAGVIVGRAGREQRRNQSRLPGAADQEIAAEALRLGGIPVDNATLQGLASVAGILTDQVLVRRLYQSTGDDLEGSRSGFGGYNDDDSFNDNRYFINTPEDSANSLQFNAILLGTYQVEVLFVLCTLLGGRCKLEAQNMLEQLDIVQVLEDMFQRLPWHRRSNPSDTDEEPEDRSFFETQVNGIHGPGCECTPESALCVQYLRLLHNFCDRDCDNYSGRRLLLSDSERDFVFRSQKGDGQLLKPGLLSKVIGAFVKESDESPYRFWLASCIESYLRGSSPEEQMFVAQSGLMSHLIDDVSSDRLHCAGSLQTSFDLLGELGKGNADVVRLLVGGLDEDNFRKLMSVAAANLVDSNVFIRSLLLSLERLSAADGLVPLYQEVDVSRSGMLSWSSQEGENSRFYLTHSWWDTQSHSLSNEGSDTNAREDSRPSDWFPSKELLEVSLPQHCANAALLPPGLDESVGHFGWVFTPGGDSLSPNTYLSNTVERLSWFLASNQARLLRDLLGVVDLRNINHENICCLNTAIVIAIFAHRRRQLSSLLEELRQMNDEEKETKRRATTAAAHRHHDNDVIDRAFSQAMRSLDLDQQREAPPYARIGSIGHHHHHHNNSATAGTLGLTSNQIGDRSDVVRNFREVLWFWNEYYTHRGRDRLSLEFSSHLRFQEWYHVVSLLVADDGSLTALLRSPPRLPRSPYQRSARVSDSPVRGN